MSRYRMAFGCALLLCAGMAMGEDGLVATRVPGGLPVVGPDGNILPPDRSIVAELKGDAFAAVKEQAQAVVRLMGNEPVWWDVGPDGAYVSVVMQMGASTYTINSWYPIFRDKNSVAVTDVGLVAVSSRRDKEARESRNSEKYRVLTKFLDEVLKKKPAPEKEAP